MLNTALFQYLKRHIKINGFSKLVKALSYPAVHEISKRGPIFLHLACQGAALTPARLPVTPLFTVEKHRSPQKPRDKAKSSLRTKLFHKHASSGWS